MKRLNNCEMELGNLTTRRRYRVFPQRSSGVSGILPATFIAAALSGVCVNPIIGAESASPHVSLTNLVEELTLAQLGEIPIETVSAASRFTQKVNEAPASVSIVTADEIRKFGYRTLADILQSLPGLYTTYDRTYTYLGVRGFSRPGDYNSRVLVMVDGHRVNDNLFGASYIGREFILDPDLIDRVEVVRGPTSSLYGNSAFFGVVNIITKSPAEMKGVEAAFEVGTLESYSYRFSGGGAIPGTDMAILLSGSYYHSVGNHHLYYPEFDSGPDNPGVADHLDGEETFSLFGKLNSHELTMSAAYVARQKNIPTASWDTAFNDPRYEAWDTHGYVALKFLHQIDEKAEVMARAYFDDVAYTADYPLFSDATPAEQLLNKDRTVGQTAGGEAQVTRRWKANTFTAGGEIRHHLKQEIENFDTDPLYFYADVDRTSTDGGIYLQDELALCTNLSVSAGVRYDNYENIGSAMSPRLGVIGHPWEDGTIKLLYGKAFRAPNVYELYYPLTDTPPDGNLTPEYIQTYEVAFDQYLPGNFRIGLAGFYYHINDLIALNSDTLAFENVDQVNTRGAEVEVEWRHTCGVRVRSSYTLEQAEDADTGERLSNSPEHLAKCAITAPIATKRLWAGLEGQYVSRCLTLPGREVCYADSFALANLTLFCENILSGLDATLSLHNVFDTHYANVGGPGTLQDLIEQDGRSLHLKLTYRF